MSQLSAATKSVLALLFKTYGNLLSGSFGSHVLEQCRTWRLQTQLDLRSAYPFERQETAFDSWVKRFEQRSVAIEDVSLGSDQYVACCREVGHPVNELFWQQLASGESYSSSKKNGIGSRTNRHETSVQLIQTEWRKALDKARSEWELAEVRRRQEELLKSLSELLSALKEVQEQLESLGLDAGVLFDLSKGNLSPQDIVQFKRWARYLAEDEGVKALCEILGKMRQIELSEHIERVKFQHVEDVWRPDPNSREEIVGIRLGRDLEHTLPSELALLADSDTAILFDLKFVESRLMCFDMSGMQLVAEHHQSEIESTVSDADKMGPIVICVDTSGSMAGMPETIAKAVALFMATKAREQKRDCYLINFSTGVETLDLGDGGGMAELIRFLQMSFHGGTDAAPALEHALTVMERDKYAKADLLVISDFVMGGLDESIQGAIEEQRTNGNKFYSLVITSGFRMHGLSSLFDQEWLYDPASSRIHEVVQFQQRLLSRGSPLFKSIQA